MYSSLALSLSYICLLLTSFLFFFFNDTATTEIYTLSLHDALPISRSCQATPREYGRGSETAHIEVRGRLQPARRRAGEPASSRVAAVRSGAISPLHPAQMRWRQRQASVSQARPRAPTAAARRPYRSDRCPPT